MTLSPTGANLPAMEPAAPDDPRAQLSWFVHRIGHEVRTPLSALTMLLSVARGRRGELPADVADLLDAAQSGTDRLARLVAALVEFVDADARPLQRENVDCRRLVRELATAVEDAGGTVEVGDLPVVEADRRALHRVFRELLANAVRHGGAAPVRIAVGGERGDGGCRFEVVDRGPGIPAEHRARVLEPLFRLRTDHDGNGLGLALCARLVARHGGRIAVAAGPGDVGTAVSFTLPDPP